MPRGQHKNSLKNLSRKGRPREYDEPKAGHRVTVTRTGWESASKLIDSMGMSVSEFLEQLGRGGVTVISTHELDELGDAIDSALLRQAIAEANGEFASPDEVLSERGLTLVDVNE